jgi:hypothetical protein
MGIRISLLVEPGKKGVSVMNSMQNGLQAQA